MSDVALPPAIQRQLDAAAELERQLTTPPADAPQDTVVEQEPDVAPAQDAQPEAAPVAQPAVAPTPEADWHQRYMSLQGKYNAEVPRLHEANRQLSARVDQLLAEVQALKAKPVEPPKPEAPVVSDKERSEFGDDLIAVVERVSEAKAKKAVEAARGVVEPVLSEVQKVQERQTLSEEQMFLYNLTTRVPDWRQIDAREDWQTWLLQKAAPGMAFTRQDILAQAYGKNLDAVVELFDAFKALQPAAPQPKPQQTELERQVAPARSKASSAPVGEKVWTMREYEDAFDVRKIRERSAEENTRLQAEADRALAEGRIRY